MTSILSYISAFIVFVLVNRIAMWLIIPSFRPLVIRYRKSQYLASFIYAFLASFFGVYTYVIISDNTPLTLSYLMLLIPAIVLSVNDYYRISKAKQGKSGVKSVLEANLESDRYDQYIDIRNEQIASNSRVFGFIVAILLFLSNEPFL